MRLINTDAITFLFTLFIALWTLFLLIWRSIRKKQQRTPSWLRFMGLFPMLLCIAHYAFFHIRNVPSLTLLRYGPLYLACVLLALWQLFYSEKRWYRMISAATFLCSGLCLIYTDCYQEDETFRNGSRLNYTEAFLTLTEDMQRQYPLSRWKGIDYDALRAELLPLVEEAQANHDAQLYYKALRQYCDAFYDGHVQIGWLTEEGEAALSDAVFESYGNDCGLSMITLDSGETIAVLNKYDSYPKDKLIEAGIHTGTVITAWDGVPIHEALDAFTAEIYRGNMPSVAGNEDFLKPLYLAGQCVAGTTFDYLDDAGNPQQYVIEEDAIQMGMYWMNILDTHPDAFFRQGAYSNYTAKMCSADCGYLYVGAEEYSPFWDFIGAAAFSAPMLRSELEKKLSTLREQGMTKLILDLRNNSGGYMVFAQTIVSLFADEAVFISQTDDEPYYSESDGAYADLEIVVLVNSNCISSGDLIASAMAQLDHVTLMGLTTTNHSTQANYHSMVMSDGLFKVAYPALLNVGTDGSPYMDTDSERSPSLLLDVKIPLTAETVCALLDDERDFELEYALAWLDKTPLPTD